MSEDETQPPAATPDELRAKVRQLRKENEIQKRDIANLHDAVGRSAREAADAIRERDEALRLLAIERMVPRVR